MIAAELAARTAAGMFASARAPVMVGLLIVGEVRVLLVSVLTSVRVSTVSVSAGKVRV